MDFFPIFADLRDQDCLVVGGGDVALRKVRQLRRAGARVTVNAPRLHAELQQMADCGDVRHAAGGFDAALIDEHLLIIAATDDASLNDKVAGLSRAGTRLCNVVDDGRRSGFIMPAVVDRSPILVAVSSGGAAPVLARRLRQQIEDWLPDRIGQLAGWVDRWRQRVQTTISGHAQRVAFWDKLLDGPVADDLLAGRPAAADRRMADALQRAHHAATGEAWLVGAGPGDPGLLTRRGLKLLQSADSVLYDSLVSAAVLDFARRDAELVCVGKRGGHASVSQAHINEELVRRVRAGERVCRLKGGDPFVFGRGGEELEALAGAGLPYQVVPGVTAASACAAYAGIPLTHRDLADGVSFVTGHRAAGQPEPDWSALAAGGHTLVVYMGTRRLAEICAALRAGGRDDATPAAIVSRGTTDQQRVIGGTLESLPRRAAQAETPAILIIGQVAALADKLRWRDTGDVRTAAVG